MIKKFLYGFAIIAALAACTDDYDDWANPQTNAPDGSITVESSATEAEPIEFANVDTTHVQLFVPTVEVPENAAVKYVVKLYNADKTTSAEVETDANGYAEVETLQAAFLSMYSRRPVENIVPIEIVTYTTINGEVIESAKIESTVKITPKAPIISAHHYLIGAPSEWNPQCTTMPFTHSGKDVYEDPIFTVMFPVGEGDTWFAMTDDVAIEDNIATGGWNQVFGCAEGDGNNGMEGRLDRRANLNDAGSWKVTVNGDARFIKMTVNMLDYTYKLEKINFMEYYYEIGNESGWGTPHALYGPNADGKYLGHYYLNGEFKFKPNEGDWNGDLEFVEGTAMGGTLTEGGGPNCPGPDAGFYRINLDVASMSYTLTPVTSISIIGDVNSGSWGTDTDLTYNVASGAWEYTGDLIAGQFKFRMNHDWTISWGGTDFSNLTEYNGANLNLAEAGNYTIQLFITHEGKNYCTVTKN